MEIICLNYWNFPQLCNFTENGCVYFKPQYYKFKQKINRFSPVWRGPQDLLKYFIGLKYEIIILKIILTNLVNMNPLKSLQNVLRGGPQKLFCPSKGSTMVQIDAQGSSEQERLGNTVITNWYQETSAEQKRTFVYDYLGAFGNCDF